MKNFYFLSGLPRSGSTLMSSLLNQNPNIHASANSPLLDMIHYSEEYLLLKSEQYRADPKPKSLHKTISSIPENYYFDIEKPVIVDKSRGWINQINHIQDYITQEPKIICPVRNIVDILSSFISLIEKNENNNFVDLWLKENNLECNNDNRCDYLMSPQGIIGLSYHAIKEAYRKGWGKYVLIVEYDDLISNPQREMNKIYDFLDMEPYLHNFSSIINTVQEEDSVYGLKDMHIVRSKIQKIHRDNNLYLSEKIMEKYKDLEFWKNINKKYSVFGF